MVKKIKKVEEAVIEETPVVEEPIEEEEDVEVPEVPEIQEEEIADPRDEEIPELPVPEEEEVILPPIPVEKTAPVLSTPLSIPVSVPVGVSKPAPTGKLVRVVTSKNHRMVVGGVTYSFVKDVVSMVPQNVKEILGKAGLLKAL